jgi:hypothetical protein
MRVPVRLRLGYRWQGEYRWRTYELDADGEPVLVGQAAGPIARRKAPRNRRRLGIGARLRAWWRGPDRCGCARRRRWIIRLFRGIVRVALLTCAVLCRYCPHVKHKATRDGRQVPQD